MRDASSTGVCNEFVMWDLQLFNKQRKNSSWAFGYKVGQMLGKSTVIPVQAKKVNLCSTINLFVIKKTCTLFMKFFYTNILNNI